MNVAVVLTLYVRLIFDAVEDRLQDCRNCQDTACRDCICSPKRATTAIEGMGTALCHDETVWIRRCKIAVIPRYGDAFKT